MCPSDRVQHLPDEGNRLSTWLNVSIALMVFMGLASGGMISLVLMATRKQQVTFSIILGLLALIALLGVVGSVAILQDTLGGLSNAIVLLVLAVTLGYALTTFSVLTGGKQKWTPKEPAARTDRSSVILLAPGEPPQYETRSAARRLELADDPNDVPPLLLRPFYMRDIKTKYSAIGSSPYRDSHIELARKVQSRLDASYTVTPAFYSDRPVLAEAVAQAIEDGARNIVVSHVRVSDPPEPVITGDLMEGVHPDQYNVHMRYTEPLWDSQLLPQIYVRRVLEALPRLGPAATDAGILLVGRGHIQADESAVRRYTQESNFLRRVRDALIRAGFDGSHVAIGWLRHSPTAGESIQALINAGCNIVYCLPASFSADGINTLFDIPAQLDPIIKAKNINFVSLGAWNADDLAAEEIAAYIRAATLAPALR
jgi:protoheme ferro-lyase